MTTNQGIIWFTWVIQTLFREG